MHLSPLLTGKGLKSYGGKSGALALAVMSGTVLECCGYTSNCDLSVYRNRFLPSLRSHLSLTCWGHPCEQHQGTSCPQFCTILCDTVLRSASRDVLSTVLYHFIWYYTANSIEGWPVHSSVPFYVILYCDQHQGMSCPQFCTILCDTALRSASRDVLSTVLYHFMWYYTAISIKGCPVHSSVPFYVILHCEQHQGMTCPQFCTILCDTALRSASRDVLSTVLYHFMWYYTAISINGCRVHSSVPFYVILHCEQHQGMSCPQFCTILCDTTLRSASRDVLSTVLCHFMWYYTAISIKGCPVHSSVPFYVILHCDQHQGMSCPQLCTILCDTTLRSASRDVLSTVLYHFMWYYTANSIEGCPVHSSVHFMWYYTANSIEGCPVHCSVPFYVILHCEQHQWMSCPQFCTILCDTVLRTASRDVLSTVLYHFMWYCNANSIKGCLYMYSTVVTVCTAQWSLYVPHSGHYMYRQFNIQ